VIEVAYPEEERQVHAWLKEYGRLRHEEADDTSGERFATEFVLKLLKKRLFSSPAAFAATLSKHEQTVTGQSEPRKGRKRPSPGILRRQIAQIDEEYADDEAYETAAGSAAAAASQLFRPLSPRERRLLNQMKGWAARASAQRDAKTNALIHWLKQVVRPDGVWNDERVIIFTEYRATQNWLHEILAAEGLAGDRLMTLYGGMDGQEREAVKAAFQARPGQSPVRILLATDAASEGIDLQNHCHRLVHFEIPWNPNRLEQRNGRIDRHGQQHDPLIYHFAPQGYKSRLAQNRGQAPGDLENDLEFLMKAAQKVEQIREDLGKVGPVIAAQVEEAMLGKRATLDTALAEADAGAVRRMLKFERDLQQRIEAMLAQLQETQQLLQLSPNNLESVVNVALALAGQPPLQPAVVDGIPPGKAFHLPPLSGSWAVCAEGLPHPHTGEMRPIVFDHDLARRRDDVVLAHLHHRLVQMSLRLLRAEVWSPHGRRNLYRVTARQVPTAVLDTPAVVAYARVVVTGGDGHRLHEEVITAGGVIRNGRFRRFDTIAEMDRVLAAATGKPVSEAMQKRLAGIWPDIRPQVERALEVRQQNLVNGMKRQLQQRAEKEQRDIEAVLTELAAAIEKELAAPSYKQLALFNDNERSQLSRNTATLEARLAQIPKEIEAEQKAIRTRYADPQPRLFPVAVTFLVPERLAD
ncbi:MAG: helicase, partial [Bacteroidetes bacterium]